jgi:glycerophosphoryl diester phosphodiesterase
MLLIAHRGLHDEEAPENSRAAFRQASEAAVDGVELDVHETQDGQFVVFHDHALERTTDMSGRIQRLSYGQLVQATLSNDESIPLLSEIIDIVQALPFINLDIKSTQHPKRLAHLLGTSGVDHRKLYLTTSNLRLQKVLNQALPQAHVGTIVSLWPLTSLNGLRSIWSPDVAFISLPQRLTYKWVIQKIHQAGKKVYVFTVNHSAQAERLRNLEVDAIFTDRLINK